MTDQQLQKIRDYAKTKMEKSLSRQHDWDHVQRVANNAVAIARSLEVKDIDLNLLRAICYLHDITYSQHKPSLRVYFREGKIAYNLLSRQLKPFNLSQKDKKIALNAIKRHPFAFPFRRLNKKQDVYTKILQDADFVDTFDPSRVANFIDAKQSQAFFIKIIKRFWNVEKELENSRQKIEKYLHFSSLSDLVESIKQGKN